MSSPISCALFIGPYRNLTTLCAATLSLHPNCQVLNHAWDKIKNSGAVAFLSDHKRENFEIFLSAALKYSKGGARGFEGGSILFSHAYADNPILQKKYHSRFGNETPKQDIRSIVWKESLIVSRYLQDQNVNMGSFFKTYPEVKLILPIRNPVDCTLSNIKTGHYKMLAGTPPPDFKSVLKGVLTQLLWAIELQNRHPEGVFSFLAYEDTRSVFLRLQSFLSLPLDQDWMKDAAETFKLRPSYAHDEKIKSDFQEIVTELFSANSEMKEKFLRFIL